MLILKIFGIMLIIMSSTGIGFALGNNMKQRLEELKELKKLFGMLMGEIKYAGTPLYEAFGIIGRRSRGIYAAFFLQTAKALEALNGKSLPAIWEELKAEEFLKESRLSEKDWDRLLRFGENLGYLDKDMQLGTIELYLENLESELKEGTADYLKNSRLCRCLGVSGGLLITILLL